MRFRAFLLPMILSIAAWPLPAAAENAGQVVPDNTIPRHHGYGAANAGGTGKLPGIPAMSAASSSRGSRGKGRVSGAGGPSTGGKSASAVAGAGTGGTQGAGSK